MPTKLSVVKSPPAIAALAAQFLASRRAKGLSVRSVEAYGHSLHWTFLPWCESEGVTDPGQLTTQLVERFTTHLLDDGGKHGNPLARASVRSYCQAVRVFLKWVADPEGGAAKVGASPALPKAQKLFPDVLSREEILRMENSATTERDKLIIRVLADTGLRLGELLQLRVEDIHEDRPGEHFLSVHGKGSRDRLVPVATPLVRRLRRYLSGRHAEAGDHVFVSLRKTANGDHPPLTISGAEQCVRLAALEAGITKRVYPHLLRHSFATEFVRRGGNLISLRNILGHFDLSMISGVYSHLNPSDDHAAMMKVLLGNQ
ncbi:MAG: tyrosine-type recombinase/integrase [Candidatus Dormibacteria bacterium]